MSIVTKETASAAATEAGTSVLFVATMTGNLELLRQLVNDDPTCLTTTTMTMTNEQNNNAGGISIHFAGFFGRLNIVKYILDYNPSLLNSETNDGFNVYFVAVHGGRLNVVKYLTKQYPFLLHQKSSKGGLVALHVACWKGYLDMVMYFVQQGPNLLKETDTNNGGTPIDWARQKDDNDIVVEFLDLVQHYLQQENEEKVAAASKCHHLEVMNHIFGLNYNRTREVEEADEAHTPLFTITASSDERVQVVPTDIKRLKYKNNNGFTPLMMAVNFGYLNIVNLIIETDASCIQDTAGPTTTTTRASRTTPFLLACERGNLEIAWLIVRKYPSYCLGH